MAMVWAMTRVAPSIYTDRTLLADLPEGVRRQLSFRGLHTKGKYKKASFVGVIIDSGSTSVFLPRSVEQVPTETRIQYACSTLKAVSRYSREGNAYIDSADGGEGEYGLEQLETVFALLEDYRHNGIYSRRLAVRKRNSGRIDWGRTLKSTTPYPDSVGAPIYLDYHGLIKQYADSCEVAAIHASVIRELDSQFSWLFSGQSHPIANELSDYPEPKVDKVARLRRELSISYSDRDVRLLKLLIRYSERQSGNEHSAFVAGLGKFHFCWEHMLGRVLSYNVTHKINSVLPAPVYINTEGKELSANEKSMRTDIILHDPSSEKCAVADAKYYAATIANNSPGWSDIVKQLFYEKALSTLSEIPESIKNVFIFPGVEAHLKEVRLRSRDVGSSDSYDFIEGFKPIYCIYVDPMEVIDNYVAGQKMVKLTEQVLTS